MDIITESLYTVSLNDYPGLPPKERMQAELRLCRTLERLLGGQEGVAAAYSAWCAAADTDDSDAAPEDKAQAAGWAKAFQQAKQDGLRDLGESDTAYFEVRLA
ncbi:MAG: hypothetical protein V4505_25510 [Pseudomonadota bacterium]